MTENVYIGRLVVKSETDTRLDTVAVYLKELVSAVNNMNDNLGGKMDKMLGKQDDLIIEVKDVNRKMDRALERVLSS